MTNEKIEKMLSVMISNKIKYNKQFEETLNHGFSNEEKEEFFEETLKDLSDLLQRGVNGEFTKGMKDSIRSLTDVAVKAGEEGRRAVTIEKLRAEKRSCLAALKMPKVEQLGYDLKYNVMQYLESAKTGMAVMRDPNLEQTQVEQSNMESCRALLEQIGDAVEKTIDISSMAAAEKYNEIVAKLRTWRINLARSGGLYDAASVGILREVLNAANAWEKLCMAGGRQAKVKDVYEIPVDDLTRVVQSEITKQNVEMFLNRCESYARETANMRNNGTAEKIMEKRAELRQIGEREQAIVAAFRNGEITRDDAEFELQMLKDKKDYANYEIERLEANRVTGEEISVRREMIAKIERPIKTSYNHVKHNRLHIHALFEGMDFTRLVGMINNNVSSQEFEVGIEEMQTTLLTRGVIDQQGQVLVDNIKKKIASVDRMNADMLGLGAEKQEEKQEGSLLDQLLGADTNKNSESLLPKDENLNTQRERSRRLDDIL